jgi:replicative DNA helicase
MPPHSPEFEWALIGCVLLDPPVFDEAARLVDAKDFFSDAPRRIWSSMVAMGLFGGAVEPTTLLEQMRKSGQLEIIGGAGVLAEATQKVGLVSSWKQYAETIAEYSRRRRLITACLNALSDAYDDAQDESSAIASLEASLAQIASAGRTDDPVTFAEAAWGAVNQIRQQKGRSSKGIHIGLEDYDAQVGGVFPGELVIVGGRPGQGKTSLCVQAAAHMARSGVRVYFASLEMGVTDLATKRLCAEANVPHHDIRMNRLIDTDYDRLSNAAEKGAPVWNNWFLHDQPRITVTEIERAARKVKADVIFVDYLQRVTVPDPKQKKRYEIVGEISASLKEVARRLNVPVVCPTQLGRSADEAKRPGMKDLRESGDIEADADQIILIHRPERPIRQGGEQWDAELLLVKNRLGREGTWRMDWEGDKTAFVTHNPDDVKQQEAF